MRTIGGPEDPADRRLVLRRQELESLLDLARASSVGAVVLHQVGLVVQMHRSPDGHLYEAVKLIASEVKPETAAFFNHTD